MQEAGRWEGQAALGRSLPVWEHGRRRSCTIWQLAVCAALRSPARATPLFSLDSSTLRPAPPRPHFRRRWQAIQDSGELRRMSRTHIHFATQPNHLRANSWATVLLQVRWGRSA